MKRPHFLFLLFFFAITLNVSFASQFDETALMVEHKYRFPGYLGVTVGYGATTWGYLVPTDTDNFALRMATPIRVAENGTLWGLYGGFEVNRFFAFEAAYMHYPTAKIYFDSASFFSSEHTLGGFVSHTQALSLVGKFMIVIPRNTNFRLYSSVGPAGVHRDDLLNNSWKLSPKFGVGLTYLITEHMMAELGIEYLAGAAVSELNPAENFIPFLYAGFARLAMRL
jgi:hypothetical protein